METQYNTTLFSLSPQFAYYPFAEGDPSIGWDSLFLSQGFPAYQGELGVGGEGQGVRATRAQGPEVDLTFYGTDIWLYGLALGSATYHTILDSVLTPGEPGGSNLLAAYTGLGEGMHSLALVVNASAAGAGLGFEYAVVGQGTGYTGATVSNSTVPMTDPSVLLAGQWSVLNTTAANSTSTNGTAAAIVTLASNGTAPSLGPTMQTTRLGDSVLFSFNGSSIAVYGALSPLAGQYYITLNSSSSSAVQTLTLNAESEWDVPSALLFWQGGLQGEHTVWLSTGIFFPALSSSSAADANPPRRLPPSSFSSSSTSTSHLPAGTVVAIALSITFLIAVLFLLLLRHRHRLASLSLSGLPFRRSRTNSRSSPSFSLSLSPASAPTRDPRPTRATKLSMTVSGRTYDPAERRPISSAEGVRWSVNPSAYSSQSSLLEKLAEAGPSSASAAAGAGAAQPEVSQRAPLSAPAPAAPARPSRPPAASVPAATLPPPVPEKRMTVQEVAKTQRAPPLTSLSPLLLPSPLPFKFSNRTPGTSPPGTETGAPMSAVTLSPPVSARPMGPRARGSTLPTSPASPEQYHAQQQQQPLAPSLLLPHPPQRSDTLTTTKTHWRTLSDAVSSAHPTSPVSPGPASPQSPASPASSISSKTSGGPAPSAHYLQRVGSFGRFSGLGGAGVPEGESRRGKGREEDGTARLRGQGRVRLLPQVPEMSSPEPEP
ncbi:hypothetical protein CALVIDRAFT_528033 [Calocera viscosa TUFC12733]|uniref:Transmembrane protein n=1 Tax=Calocera viscosa (strain TUFC12733) TaxID=1330018 RepID=A0A167LDN5_CALVF|nr:hypothetical protein CALVIDRAFT_528033 [Calocera viscosa TUFC12733]